jgi:hypothetical protein
MLGPVLERRLKGRRRTVGTAAVGGLFGLFFLAGFATPTPGLSQPADAQALDRIAAMPADTVIGGVSDQLDYLPALTQRPTLATIEHSIPYHTGYFTPLRERLERGLAAVSSPDPAMLADYVRRYGVKVIAVDRALFEYGQLPARWSTVVPDAVRTSQEMLEQGPSVLQQRAPGCLIHTGALILLDAPCLTRG